MQPDGFLKIVRLIFSTESILDSIESAEESLASAIMSEDDTVLAESALTTKATERPITIHHNFKLHHYPLDRVISV
jgi:hypothetical protein